MNTDRFPHDTTLDGLDEPRAPRPEQDPDDAMEAREERARMGRIFSDDWHPSDERDEWDDGRKRVRRPVCLDRTGARFRD